MDENCGFGISDEEVRNMIINNPACEQYIYLSANNNTYWRHEYGKLIDEYLETEHGKKITNYLIELQNNKEITSYQYEEVILSSTHDYKLSLKRKETMGTTDFYEIIQAFPEIFSIVDIIKFKSYVDKDIFIIPERNSDEVNQYFENCGFEFTRFTKNINSVNLCIYVLINAQKPKNDISYLTLPIGHVIFNELESKRKICTGYVYYRRAPNGVLGRSIGMKSVRLPNLRDLKFISQNGYRQDLAFGFRSSWEANLVRVFECKNMQWEYEKTSFSLSSKEFSGYYFPDFFLENNIVIEVKGYWDEQSRRKVSIFKLQYPQYELLIIDKDMYYDLQKVYKNIIPEWEFSRCSITKQIIQVKKAKYITRNKEFKSLSKGAELSFIRMKNDQNQDVIEVFSKSRLFIGWVTDDWSCILTQKIDLGYDYSVKLVEVKEKFINIEITRKNSDEIILPTLLSFL